MTVRRKKTKRGGTKLGEGTYGCVITPPPSCHGEKLANDDGAPKVAKVFKREYEFDAYGRPIAMLDYADEEWDLAKAVHKLDPKNKWSPPVYQRCELPVKHMTYDKKECELTKHLKDSELATYIVMKYGGSSLEDLVDAKETISLEDFKTIMHTCLFGISALARNEWIHMDIKPGNILFDPKEKKCYLIDFSLMTPYDETLYVPDRTEFLRYKYPWFPPEFYIAVNIDRKTAEVNVHTGELRMRMAKLYTNLHLPQGFVTRIIEETMRLKNRLEKEANNFAAHPLQLLEMARLKEKIDVFSLGVSLLQVYNVCVNEKDSDIEDILVKMCNGNPFERIFSTEAMHMLIKVGQKKSPSPSRILPLPIMAKLKTMLNRKNNS